MKASSGAERHCQKGKLVSVPLRNASWSLKVITPVDGIIVLFIVTIYWSATIFIRRAPGGCVASLLLGAHATCFLVLEFPEQACALLHCRLPFPEGTPFLRCLWQGHRVDHGTHHRFAFPPRLVMHPRTWCPYPDVCQARISPSGTCGEQGQSLCGREGGHAAPSMEGGHSQGRLAVSLFLGFILNKQKF